MTKFATFTITTIHRSGTGNRFAGYVRHFDTMEDRDAYIATGEKVGEEAPFAVNASALPREGKTVIFADDMENVRAGA